MFWYSRLLKYWISWHGRLSFVLCSELSHVSLITFEVRKWSGRIEWWWRMVMMALVLLWGFFIFCYSSAVRIITLPCLLPNWLITSKSLMRGIFSKRFWQWLGSELSLLACLLLPHTSIPGHWLRHDPGCPLPLPFEICRMTARHPSPSSCFTNAFTPLASRAQLLLAGNPAVLYWSTVHALTRALVQ
jgi:hypothetical protein